MITEKDVHFSETHNKETSCTRIQAHLLIRFETEVEDSQLRLIPFVKKDLRARIDQLLYGEAKQMVYDARNEIVEGLARRASLITSMECWELMRPAIEPLLKIGIKESVEDRPPDYKYPRWVLEDLYYRNIISDAQLDALLRERIK